MTNKIGIDDKVKVVLGEGKEKVVGNGEVVTITQISKMSGEIYYVGEYHVKCSEGGEGYDTTIQFKEGQYKATTDLSDAKFNTFVDAGLED